MTLQKITSVLTTVFFMSFAGATLAAPATQSGDTQGVSSGKVAQAQTPPDCKKDPTDPRCKSKK